MPTLTRSRERAFAEMLVDPVGFSTGILGHKLWPVQRQIMRSVARNRRTAVKSCHASGKTFLAADLALWWATRYPDGMVIVTGPSWEQIERVLFGLVHLAIADAERVCGLRYPSANQSELRLGPNRYAIGLSTNRGVRFQGFHGRILIIVDEAPGLMQEIWNAISGIAAAGQVHVLALGNPDVASGTFHDAFTSQRESWETFTISAFDTPNLAGLAVDDIVHRERDDPFLFEGSTEWGAELTSRYWVWEKWREWGKGHPLWDSRVLGEFPAQAEDALISLAWLLAARGRAVVDDGGPITAGLDVAGEGSAETVLYVRSGPNILHEPWCWPNADPRGEVIAALEPYLARLQAVNVDSAGMGYYFGLHLRDVGLPVNLVNVGERTNDAERFTNLKGEYYWGLRQRFDDGDVAGLTDEKTIAQLAGIRYKANSRGQTEIESKDSARKRGVASPDRAEGLMLAFGGPAPLQAW